MPELATIAGGGSVLVLAVFAIIRVLTFDRDEAAVIKAWKERAEAETERADRYDRENRELRRENRRLRRIVDDANIAELGRENMRQAIEEQKARDDR